MMDTPLIEIDIAEDKLLIATLYRPRSDVKSLEHATSDTLVEYSKLLVMSDFTCNLFNLAKSILMRSCCRGLHTSFVRNSLPTRHYVSRGSIFLFD